LIVDFVKKVQDIKDISTSSFAEQELVATEVVER